MITITEKCNLDCIYCYEKYKTPKTIPYDLAIQLIENELLNCTEAYNICEISFHGGEPFMEFQLIKKICEYFWSRNWSKNYYFFTTTNGTLIHGEVQQWLVEHKDRFVCGLSLDGNKFMQDINRNNSFDDIDIDFFIETWPEQEIKMTISNLSLPHYAEGIIYLQEKGFKISDNFAYGLNWNEENNADVLLEQLLNLMEYYYDNPNIQPSRLLSVNLDYLAYDIDDERTCSIGKGMSVYDVEGNKYPCHFFEPLAIGKELSEKSKDIDFSLLELYSDNECMECEFRKICPTCYGANYASTGNIACRDKNMCFLTKISALATAKFMWEKAKRFGMDSISPDKEKQKAILHGIHKVQEII